MLAKGPAKRVTIWVNEETKYHGSPLWLAVLEFLRHKQVAGASVFHSNMGFGSRRAVHRADSPETPACSVRLEFVDTEGKVEEVLPTLYEMVGDGLIEMQDTTVIKSATAKSPEVLEHSVRRMPAKVMRIFLGEADQCEGEPLYDAIVRRLHMIGIAGATVYRGVLGYGAKGHTHKQGLLRMSRDLPVEIAVVDEPDKIDRAVAVVEEMLGDGLIVVGDVEAIRVLKAPSGRGS